MPKQVLIYRLGSLGDICISLPAFRVIQEAFPGARLVLLANAPVNAKAVPAEAVLREQGIFAEYISYPVETRNLFVLMRLWRRLRRQRFDAVVNLTAWRGSMAFRRDRLFFRLVGAKRYVGFDADEARRPLATLTSGLVEHEATRLLARVKALGTADAQEQRWHHLALSDAIGEETRGRLDAAGIHGLYLVASVGAKVPAKDWDQPNWLELFRRLGREHPELGCVFIGAPDEAERSAACLREWRGPILNLCGQVSPAESAAVLAGARLFIGHDSGPMHLAAAVGTRCVIIFAARTLPGRWFPLGRGHTVLYRRTDCLGCELDVCAFHRKKCLTAIRVDEVEAAVREMLLSDSTTEVR